jgi:tetratricopeptide (TPR) repeat protein
VKSAKVMGRVFPPHQNYQGMYGSRRQTMKNRQEFLLFFSVIILVAFSQLQGSIFTKSTDLPNPKRIDGSGLANVPPVDDAIMFMQEKIRANPEDAVSYTLLGELYLRQAREAGDISAYKRAEESLEDALALLPGYSPAGSSLASVYYSTHDFSKALDLAEQVYESNAKNTQARIIVADSYLSMGDYEMAESIYTEIGADNPTPPVLARLANIAELRGDSNEALSLIRRAAGDTLRSGSTKENAAWYLLRVGDIYFNQGDIKMAGEFYEASLRVFNDYYLALAGMGKVYTAEGKYDKAIAYYHHAINIVPQPDFLAALGDLYIANGQPGQAELQYEVVDYIGRLASPNQQVYNRQLANFYSDHDMKLDQALELSLAELDSRKDVYGYDAAAWAYYKNSNYKDAQTMMDLALALGTRDARLYYHAGMIAFALHDNEKAGQYLDQAMTINPHFSILQAGEAQNTLTSLRSMAAK